MLFVNVITIPIRWFWRWPGWFELLFKYLVNSQIDACTHNMFFELKLDRLMVCLANKECTHGMHKLCENLNGTWHPGWSQDRILICESLQSMWLEVSIAFTLVKIACWCDTMKLLLPNDPNTHAAPTWTRHEMLQEEEVELDTKYTRCNGCGKKFPNDSYLKAHCWNKPNCRRAAPTWMQNVIPQEEMELDTYTRCNGCG